MRKSHQAKHIDDIEVLRFLWNSECMGSLYQGCENSVLNAMPEWANEKLARAKMASLIKRGLVDGCMCGCRGDFELTEKGTMVLREHDHWTIPQMVVSA